MASGDHSKLQLNNHISFKHKIMRERGNKGPNQSAQTLGQLIQNFREQTGISVRTLAEELGISFSMVSAIEREKTFPRHQILEKIANLLKVESSELRKLDGRLRIDHLRRVIEKNPKLNDALRTMVEQIRQGQASPDTYAEAITMVAAKH